MVEADDVIAATGFSAPLGDLPAAGLKTVADGRLPALTPFWEGIGVPGVFFAGNVTQAARGRAGRGVVNLSSMVCGFRYNARILARHLAERLDGQRDEGRLVAREALVPLLAHEIREAEQKIAEGVAGGKPGEVIAPLRLVRAG